VCRVHRASSCAWLNRQHHRCGFWARRTDSPDAASSASSTDGFVKVAGDAILAARVLGMDAEFPSSAPAAESTLFSEDRNNPSGRVGRVGKLSWLKEKLKLRVTRILTHHLQRVSENRGPLSESDLPDLILHNQSDFVTNFFI
jgi:hypothetical protein